MATVAGVRVRCPKCGGAPKYGSDEFGNYIGCITCGALEYVKNEPMPYRSHYQMDSETMSREIKTVCMAMSIIPRVEQGRVTIMASVGPPAWYYIRVEAVLRSGPNRNRFDRPKVERIERVDIWGLPDYLTKRDMALICELIRGELIRALDNRVEALPADKLWLHSEEEAQ